MPIHIRDATRDDQEALTHLLAEINNQHAEALPVIYQHIVPSIETENYVCRIIDSEELGLSVAEQAGQVVGFVVFQESQAPETPVHVLRRWALVSLIVVSRALRSQGIGTALIQHVQEWAKSRGIDTVELQVAEFNTAAIAWYESLGFRSQYRHMAWSAEEEGRE